MDPKKPKTGGARLLKGDAKPPKPKKQLTRRQKILRVVYALVTVMALLVVVVFAASRLLFVRPTVETPARPNAPVNSGEGTEELDTEDPGVHASGRKDDFYTFLVIGRDTGGGGNTDTILLAAYDVAAQEVNVMSIPRDTMVNVSWDIKRINSVYNMYGGGDEGIEALDREISQLVGFVPDFQVVVEWKAVGELVDAIGGVWYDVPRDMYYWDPTQDLLIDVDKGYQKLDGDKAMQVVRFRDGPNGYVNGDLGRIETQQGFLKALMEQCLQITNITRIRELAQVFTDNVTTNLTIPNILWFAQQALLGNEEDGSTLSMDNVCFYTMPCTNKAVWSRGYGNMQSYVVPNTDELVDLVNQCFNPYVDDLDSNELDIMYVNSDGTIGSSTGTLEDTRHNSAWIAHQTAPEPEESETPEETGAPESTETPGETEGPVGESAPPESSSPGADMPEDSQPPEESAPFAPSETEPGEAGTEEPAETETTGEAGAAESETPVSETPEGGAPASEEPGEATETTPPAETESTAPETDGGETEAPPEGIPIF